MLQQNMTLTGMMQMYIDADILSTELVLEFDPETGKQRVVVKCTVWGEPIVEYYLDSVLKIVQDVQKTQTSK